VQQQTRRLPLRAGVHQAVAQLVEQREPPPRSLQHRLGVARRIVEPPRRSERRTASADRTAGAGVFCAHALGAAPRARWTADSADTTAPAPPAQIVSNESTGLHTAFASNVSSVHMPFTPAR
jgi:hypothetical protein